MARNQWKLKLSSPITKVTGFTLVEMVVVIAIAGLLAASGATLLGEGLRAAYGGRDANALVVQGQLALERLNRDLHLVRSATTTDLTPGATSLTLRDTAGTTITYSLSGTTLLRNTRPLADGVSALSFSYTQRDGLTPTTIAGEVFYITATLTLNSNDATATLRTTVHPRNIP